MTAAADTTQAAANGVEATAPLHVAHVGLLGEQPGGMAQVVNEYLRWSSPAAMQIGVLTARRRRDPAAPLLAAAAVVRLLRLRRDARTAGARAVVVVHLSERGSFVREGALLIWSRLLGMPTVAHLHGADFEAFSGAHPRLVRTVLRSASAIAALTERSSDAVRRTLPGGPPVVLVPNVVAAARRPLRTDPVVLFGGEVSARKGADLLLSAWTRLADRFPAWTLQIAGPVSRTSPLPEALPPRVELLGPLRHEELLDRAAGAAVAVLPSRAEALPMFLIEAMAHGCAVVGTAVGQVPELLRDGAGLVVPSDDRDALEAALAQLMGSAAQRERVAAAGVRRFEQRYSATHAKDVLLSFWSRVAGA